MWRLLLVGAGSGNFSEPSRTASRKQRATPLLATRGPGEELANQVPVWYYAFTFMYSMLCVTSCETLRFKEHRWQKIILIIIVITTVLVLVLVVIMVHLYRVVMILKGVLVFWTGVSIGNGTLGKSFAAWQLIASEGWQRGRVGLVCVVETR